MEKTQEKKATVKQIAEPEVKKMSIYEKMQKITEEMGVIQKNLSIQAGSNKYKAVSERDILDNVKPLEAKYRIYSYPFERNILQSDILVKETEYQGKATKTNSLFMRIEAIYRFVNIDMPEQYIDIKSYADGIDTGDKAAGKAMTYADKYALMKAYKISTGDDPDKDPSPENGYAKKPKIDYRKELISYCQKNSIDLKKVAKDYKMVGKKLSNDDYLDILEDIKAEEARLDRIAQPDVFIDEGELNG